MILVTGSLGLVGSEAVRFFLEKGANVVGVDNNMRREFFGKDGDVSWNKIEHPRYTFYDLDIRDTRRLFKKYKFDLIIHAAAQPSHDWAATNPILDFSVNAKGTLELLEAFRHHCPKGVFIYVSTNKVYGDRPNHIGVFEYETRYVPELRYISGIDESMSIDNSMHSLFGVSKLAGDLMTQEYGKYFGLQTGVFRCGCITGSHHSAVPLHGFLAYMARCKKMNIPYVVNGYKGKQVRDNIHAYDLVNAFYHFFDEPKYGEVYNMGGGTHSNISVLEALDKFVITNWQYLVEARKGDHIWYISDVTKFRRAYPRWEYKYTMEDIIANLISA